MPNSYYNHATYPSPNAPGSSAALRAELDLVTAGFNLLPTLAGNGYKVAMVNAAGTALIASAALQNLTIDNSPIGATTANTGRFTTVTATAASGFFGNLVGNVTGDITSAGTSTFANVTISGSLDMQTITAATISGLNAPSNNSDAANKGYVDTQDALKLSLAGGTMSGNIAMGTNRITGMGDPSSAQDAATKNYIDTLFGSTTAAAASAAAAATSATNAANSATAAATSASNASTSASNAASSYTTFNNQYLGPKASDPSVNNTGGALVAGNLYFNTTASEMRVYNGTVWAAAYLPAAGYLPLAGGTMTGAITFSGGQTWPTFNQSTTGNAATATALQTARTINGVSFDGTANITVADSTKLPLAGGTMSGAITFAGGQTFPGVAATATGNTFTATQTFNGSSTTVAAVLKNAAESPTVSATAATGTINFDVLTQAILFYTSNASGNWTLNVRGSSGTSLNTLMSTNQTITIVFMVTNGATAYYQTAFQIDGSSVTPKWINGAAPSAGNASSIDVYTFTITKTASATFTVLGAQARYA